MIGNCLMIFDRWFDNKWISTLLLAFLYGRQDNFFRSSVTLRKSRSLKFICMSTFKTTWLKYLIKDILFLSFSWSLRGYDTIKTCRWNFFNFSLFIMRKYGKIRFKNTGSPCYFLSSRSQKIKILQKLNKRDCF